MVSRADLIAEARAWIGTPYHNCADIKGVGTDCGMILVRTHVDIGLVPPFDPRPYPSDWHLHRSEERYLRFLSDRARGVKKPKPGDVIVLKVGRCYSHGGIVTIVDPLTVVHAVHQYGRVVEEEVGRNAAFAERLFEAKYFSVFDD
jgi:hypothetical protein